MFDSTNQAPRQIARQHGFIATIMALGVSICLLSGQAGAILAQADEPDGNQAAAEDTAAPRQQSMNNLKQIVIAMQNYHDSQKSFPPAFVTQDGKPTLSWRVVLLPYLAEPDGNKAYTELHLNEPWDSEHNKPLVAKMPKVYRSPASKLNDGRTVYLTPRGPETAFPGEKAVKIKNITDGLLRTIAVLEVDDMYAVPWTKPDDWTLDPDHPKTGLGGQFDGGFNVAFFYGPVHFLNDTIDDKVMRALFTIAGREGLPSLD